MLYYARLGKDVFRGPAPVSLTAPKKLKATGARRSQEARFDVAKVEAESAAHEAAIWQTLVYELRRVTRADYDALAKEAPRAKASPSLWTCAPGGGPVRVPDPTKGRRTSHAVNATKP